MNALRRFLSRINARLRILATDEESAMYDRVDRELRRHGQ